MSSRFFWASDRATRVLTLGAWVTAVWAARAPLALAWQSVERSTLDSRFWADVSEGTTIRPCEAESDDARAAKAKLEELDELVEALALGESSESLAQAILELLHTPCFLLALEIDRLPRPDSAESLKRWWEDGGRDWLWSYIELPKAGTVGDLRAHIVVPPDDRPTLSSRTRRGLRFAAFLCRAEDERCRAETRGWRRRAEVAIESRRDGRELVVEQDHWYWQVPYPGVLEKAVQRVCFESKKPTVHYREFRECADSVVERTPALPLGAIRAPRSGWLLVAGRRGHYEYCDELDAYNLENGDALRARRCSALALKKGGEVDFEATERRARDEVDAGTLNVENLREAAWMLLMSTELARLRTRATYVELPRGMERSIEKAGEREVFGWGWSGSTAQTTLIWSFAHADFHVEGEAIWPFSDDPAEEHVARLLEIAEASWRAHCPAAAPPPSALARLYPGVNARDSDVDTFEGTFQRLKRSIATWRTETCKPPAHE